MKKFKTMVTAGIISASIIVSGVFSTMPAMADTSDDLANLIGLGMLDYVTGGAMGDLLTLGVLAEALDGSGNSYDTGAETDDVDEEETSDTDSDRINVTDEEAGFGFLRSQRLDSV